jgi:hypothetical protein
MNNTTKLLQKPFHPDDIEWRVQRESRDGSSVLVLAYVTNRAIQARLDEVFSPFGWQNSFREGPQGGLICKIGARASFGDQTAEWIWKEDGAENTKVEAIKGGLSSAMKRAAVQWGIGRYLYNLTDNWTKLQDGRPSPNSQKQKAGFHQGRYWATPDLPEWAMPEEDHTINAVSDEFITDGMKATLWNHVKAHWDDDAMRKDVYQQAFDLFGQGDTMKFSVFQTACNWVAETSKKAAPDPIAKKVKHATP